jgi:predicted MPP superfamily phosphohydrolase
MSGMYFALVLLAIGVAWVGHACLWISLLNNFYGRALPKWLLKPWRLLTGLVILAFPLILLSGTNPKFWNWVNGESEFLNGLWGQFMVGYAGLCLLLGGVVFPAITVARLLRKTPACVVSEATRTLDLWPELGHKLPGDGYYAWVTRAPGNCVFCVDFTDLTLSLPDLPPEWDGLTILVLTDLHFHGTPARPYFDRIIDELAAGPVPDLVCLVGDYVDTKTHHEWIRPVLGRLIATEAKFAILGNHDWYQNPDRVREELSAAGYTVLGNGWREVTIRGVRSVVVGHEGPWFRPGPDLTAAPAGVFRLCLSHTPDNFYWGAANRVGLMLCGHVHGGQIRLPVVGSLFVPSVYGRRFDRGVFEKYGTAMVVSRGVSGKEPLRFRCHPQVMRITLVRQKPV